MTASVALYLNLPGNPAAARAGTRAEPPFLVAQMVTLAAMIAVGALSFRAARRV
ncbi:hypothetical protein WBP06_16200 [Novosphingobium sp. BL-8H]|uniref:hypothetical protein n=1 Tax=Novosphingobium sp. BL-8H TaxID=3127640 RepID=UPI003757C205